MILSTVIIRCAILQSQKMDMNAFFRIRRRCSRWFAVSYESRNLFVALYFEILLSFLKIDFEIHFYNWNKQYFY